MYIPMKEAASAIAAMSQVCPTNIIPQRVRARCNVQQLRCTPHLYVSKVHVCQVQLLLQMSALRHVTVISQESMSIVQLPQ